MHLLVSFCNPKLADLSMLGLFDLALNEIDILELPPELPAMRGFTGLACSEEHVFVAVQALEMGTPNLKSPASLLIFDRKTFALRNHAILRTAVDVHSLCVSGDTLHVASTGRDEVLRLRIANACVVSEEPIWRPDPQSAFADDNHLNSICIWDGNLCVSAFGCKSAAAPNAERNGFIFDISRHEYIAQGLDQPHSLCVVDDDLAFCDSRHTEVAFVRSSKRVSLPGYARGLCRLGGELIAGTSVGRKVSRSTNRVNNPAAIGEAEGRCALHRINISSMLIAATVNLGFCSSEIYDILPVDNVSSWPIVDRVKWRNHALESLTCGMDAYAVARLQCREDLNVLNAELEKAKAEAVSAAAAEQGARRESEASIAALRAELLRSQEVIRNHHNSATDREKTIAALTEELEKSRLSADAQSALLASSSAALNAREQAVQSLQSRLNVVRTRLKAESQQRRALLRRLKAQSSHMSDMRTVIANLQETVHSQSEQIMGYLYSVAGAQAEISASGAAGHHLPEREDYRRLVGRVRDAVRKHLPHNAVVAVVGKGDEELLSLYGRKTRHFPFGADGSYPGFYPANSLVAIAQLETLRSEGVSHLLFPSVSFWWLDSYPGLRRYLDNYYKLCHSSDDACMIYGLSEKAAHVKKNDGASFAGVVDEFRERFGHDPAILNWTDIPLAADFPRLSVVSIEPTGERIHELPYLDRSIELVVVADGDADILAEGRRVAEKAFVVVPGRTRNRKPEFEVQWLHESRPVKHLTASIIIPMFNGLFNTENCLKSLLETLPLDYQAEIIVVDDASSADTARRMAKWPSRDSRIRILRNRENLGFLGSVNRGAQAASGDVLVLLNNDTILLSHWLPPLLATFAAYPDAGAVGGRLLYPDGRLQEAGGVVFCDGSAAQFGHRDYNPDAELYRAVREVDYCSGALLATPRTLFEQLGGLDTAYGFGYYEDTDYCFRIREIGKKVYYQPDSTIIHIEGGSCGTDLNAGIKRWQVENRERFCLRWSGTLQFQHEPPESYGADTWLRLAVREHHSFAAPGPELCCGRPADVPVFSPERKETSR